MTEERDLGVLAITHYARLLTELRADRVHVLMGGPRRRPAAVPSSPTSSSSVGYEGLAAELGVETLAVEAPAEPDPFADTTIESNPFADPLA